MSASLRKDQRMFVITSSSITSSPRTAISFVSFNHEYVLGCMLAQVDPEMRKEMPVYYLSKKMLDYELNYTQLEKICLELKSVKGRIIAEQLADAPTEDAELSREFPDEGIMTIMDAPNLTTCTMYFDGASNSKGKGINIVLVSRRDEHIPISIKLDFDYTNNVAEYEACIAGLEVALYLEVQDLDVYGDSLLIISQTNGKWLTKEDRLIHYHTYLMNLIKSFHNISFTYISTLRNRFVDVLATLASMVDIPVGVKVLLGNHPEASLKERRALPKLASRYVICGGDLHRRSFDGVQLLCVDEDRAAEILEDVHSGICGPHMNVKMLARKILRLVWGIDIIGKVSPKSSSGHEYILVAIDYFTKWIEAKSYASISSASVAKFIGANIICRYGVPHKLISDNGSHFKKEVASLCQEFKIKHHKSYLYRPQTNGAVEAANKNIKTIIRKMTRCYKDWSNKLPYVLWAYRTSVRTSTGATPYSLTYGMEAVLPIELKIPSLRILMESDLPESEWARIRHQELCMMDEKRLKAAYHVQGYQRRLEKGFQQEGSNP
ncbi:uncharacterized protein LOC143883137 [Tasmannia lanceolata]|uniref:uncharacterized protein LOC143883137 n=1 Tax=Tasmannia lanceolata TaxID=3420 RepID=UPI004064B28B